MPLNENVNWADAGMISTAPGAYVCQAFRFGKAEKVLLPTGMKLYKFNDFSTPTRPGSKEMSAWWSPYDAYRHDAGWEQRKRLAQHFGVSIRELGRVTSAVKENWNSMQYLLTVTLKEQVYAFFGGFAQMPRIDRPKNGPPAVSKMVTTAPGSGGEFMAEGRGLTRDLPGGGTQFFIPNLTLDEISNWQTESLLAL